MQAIVHYRFGSPEVLKLEEVEKPAPNDDEVLIKVHAVSINGSDWEGLRGKPLYARLGGLRNDLILDIAAHHSVFAYQRALKHNGRYYTAGGSVTLLLQILLLGPWIRRTTGKNIHLLMVHRNRDDLVFMTELCKAGKIVPMIDRRYPLHEVPEALRYVGEGRAKGKVVITIE